MLAAAQRVQVDLRLDDAFLESLLRQQVFRTGALRINDDGSGCQFLELTDPRVDARDGHLLVRTRAIAKAGRAIGTRCLLILDWRGQLEFKQVPSLNPGQDGVILTTESWRAVRADGTTDTTATTVAQWLEQFMPIGLRRTEVDLRESLQGLREFTDLSVRNDGRAAVDAITLDAVGVAPGAVSTTLGMTVVTREPAAATAQPEPILSPEEFAQFKSQLLAIDAFYTYTVSHLGIEGDPSSVTALFEVLVNLRTDLLALLETPARADEAAARRLFMGAWETLAPILTRLAGAQSDYASALHYLSFIGAGEALRVLDQLGPAMGIELSNDGLRRLARILLPQDPADPLQRTEDVDPQLRAALGFGAPLPPPSGAPDASWIEWFIPQAVADSGLDAALVQRLNNWVPSTRDMPEYLPMVRRVLREVVAQQLRANALDATYHDLFKDLVFSAAWQESCWRQFEARNRMRVPVESGSGDLGIMQINPTVWRGLYDLHGLRWDIVYNARAGADILEHYLIRYALSKGEHTVTGGIVNLARSTYAAYNGGPRRYDRYRRADSSDESKKVDALFYEKYRQVADGNELAVSACYSS